MDLDLFKAEGYTRRAAIEQCGIANVADERGYSALVLVVVVVVVRWVRVLLLGHS